MTTLSARTLRPALPLPRRSGKTRIDPKLTFGGNDTRLARHGRAKAASVQVEDPTGIDFYSVLGVSPSSSKIELKAAYRKLMRSGQVHPDHAFAWKDDDGSVDTPRAVLVNLIYDILMDDEQRAEYNVLAGFSTTDGANPFSSFYIEQTRSKATGGDYVFVD